MKGKKVHINASECPFSNMKLTSQRRLSFAELAEDGGIILARSQGVPLPTWEDLEETKPKLLVLLDPRSS